MSRPVFDFFAGLAIGALVATLVCVGLYELARPARKSAPPSAPAATTPAPSPWTAMPGGKRLELGASGFAITLNTGPTGQLYALWSPEGRPCGETHDLLALKQWGERLAAERAEFERVAPQPHLFRTKASR